MLCPRCGHENSEDALFCAYCGVPLGQEGINALDDGWEEYEEELPAHRSRAPLVIVLVVLILVAAGFGLSVGWHQTKGEWPWETLRGQAVSSSQGAAPADSHEPMLTRPDTADYNAAMLAASVAQSGFQDFRVTENEISNIQKDQNLSDVTSYRFTVTKPMAVLHMELRLPQIASDDDVNSLGSASAGSTPSQSNAPQVMTWAVDTWKLTGVWNDEAGNSLVITSCEAGTLEGSFVPNGSTAGIPLTGSVSEQGTVSLLGSKTEVSGTFSPAGTGNLIVKSDNQESPAAEYVMLSTAVPTVPQASVSSATSDISSSANLGQNLQKGDIFPQSSKRLLTDLDFVPVVLSGQAADKLALARNEIYARHGLDFKKEPYRSHFYALDWYKKLPKVTTVPDSKLSDIERKNIEKIQAYEKRY